jgi:hypothetical protein
MVEASTIAHSMCHQQCFVATIRLFFCTSVQSTCELANAARPTFSRQNQPGESKITVLTPFHHRERKLNT